ncbi:MAG: acylneuraminate cytidylyltransferase family protein [Verrucomicrobiota bacterium]|nr:acylneuraminate cytidylyltransferase family protein [Verrucomicrobiota bacterium]
MSILTPEPCKTGKKRVAALIPARAGSKRLQGKNVRVLNGHPLLAYTICAARNSGVFDAVIVSSEDEDILRIARAYGAETPFRRPEELAADHSADIGWIQHALSFLSSEGRIFDSFSILRPTSPFRQPETIRRAWQIFLSVPDADSLRAVELCKQHPGKMWVMDGALMKPLMDDGGASPPWHSSAYQTLPEIYAQNASLEIAWTRVPMEAGTIAGKKVVPFVTENWEGFDINKPEDWWLAELLIDKGLAMLPSVCLT